MKTLLLILCLTTYVITSSAQSDLEVSLNSFHNKYAGKYFGLSVGENYKRWRRIPKCPTTVFLKKGFATNKLVSFFVDTNADARYSLPPDRAYQLRLSDKPKVEFNLRSKAVAVEKFDVGKNVPSNNYNASITFEKFDRHKNKILALRLTDLQGGKPVATIKVKLKEACQHFYLENILEPYRSYRLDIFADRDGNQQYDGLGKDRSWTIFFSHVTNNIVKTFDYEDKANAAFYDKKIEAF